MTSAEQQMGTTNKWARGRDCGACYLLLPYIPVYQNTSGLSAAYIPVYQHTIGLSPAKWANDISYATLAKWASDSVYATLVTFLHAAAP